MTFEKPHISVQGLDVHIGDNHILKDINIDIPNKKVTSIIGPSGCGKTTLLKTFNRLLDNTSDVKITGKVLVDGENIYDPNIEITHIRKKMGLLSQRPYPLPMSIYDNIAYGPRIHGSPKKKDLDILVEEQLKNVGLWDEVKDRLNAPATRLSIGQQQRLFLARGFAVGPEMILGDESTSALDPLSTHIIEDLFMKLKEKYSIVLVTHILRQAARVSDYIIFVYMGKIIEYGPAEQILKDPQEQLTKEYVKGYII